MLARAIATALRASRGGSWRQLGSCYPSGSRPAAIIIIIIIKKMVY
jgi:hypothetical protein